MMEKKDLLLICFPFKNISFSDIHKIWPETKNIKNDVVEQIEIESQYAGYLDRQRDDISDFKKEERLLLPKNIKL